MDQELIGYLDSRFERLEGRMERMESRLGGVEERLTGVEDSVRQTQVMVEGVRDDIRLVAEGVIGSNERLDRVQGEIMAKIEAVGGLIKSAFTAVDYRLKALESWQERSERDPVEIVRERYGRPKA